MRKSQNRSQPIAIPMKYRKRRKKTPFQASTLKIGEVAKKTGIPIVTLRFYEKEGLIESLNTTESQKSSHRRFSPAVFLYLDFIKLCRDSGFSLAEIRDVLKLYRGFKTPSRGKMLALKRSIDLVREQKGRLARVERALLHRLRNPEADIEELFEIK